MGSVCGKCQTASGFVNSHGDRGRVVLQAPDNKHCATERRGQQVLHRQALALEPCGNGDRLGLRRRRHCGALALRLPHRRPQPQAVLVDEFDQEAAGDLARLHVAVHVGVMGHPNFAHVEVGGHERALELRIGVLPAGHLRREHRDANEDVRAAESPSEEHLHQVTKLRWSLQARALAVLESEVLGVVRRSDVRQVADLVSVALGFPGAENVHVECERQDAV